MLFNFILKSMPCHVHFTAKDRLERFKSIGFPLFIDAGTIVGKLLDAEHYTVIRNRHTLHSIFDSLIYKVRYLGLAVKNRIISMDM